MEIDFLKYRKLYFAISGILVLASIVFLAVFGLKLGIDFLGGSILEIDYAQQRPSNQQVKEQLAGFDLGEVVIQSTGERGVIIRTKEISEEMHQEVLGKLKEQGELEETRFESIGPVIGQEVKEKTKIVIVLALASILFYVTFAFRKVSKPVKSWQYGIATILALFHDVLIPIGIFSILGKFYMVEITVPIITALLTVFGYSVNDTVVVFDRIREKLRTGMKEGYLATLNTSVNETLGRTVITSFTTLLTVLSLYFFGGAVINDFSFALLVGVIVGTYSSIFVATPLLAEWYTSTAKKLAKRK